MSAEARRSNTPLAVVLVSGGMDSCVTAAIAAREYELALLHVSYGQRTERRERQAFEAIADFYSVPAHRRMAVSIAHLAAIGGSSLTDRSIDVPPPSFEAGRIPVTYVPFRNANMLAIAVSWAEILGAEAICIGAVEEDSSGYPDCRAVFFDAFNRVIETGTKFERPLRIITPIIHLDKEGIVRKGMELGAPLHLTWSCYRNEDEACGECESCALRLKGFRLAGIEDPIPYVRR